MEVKIININEFMIQKFVEKIRPENPEIRKQLDIGYSFHNQIFELVEMFPQWNNPTEILSIPFARIKFVKRKKLWKLYWKQSNGSWKLYQPFSYSTHLDAILNCIEKDTHSCFFG